MELDRQIPPNVADVKSIGITLDFAYTPELHNGYFDVDNVCEPVFSILVNRKGWFRKSRKYIKWFTSTKRGEGDAGVRISLRDSEPPEFDANPNAVVFDRVFSGVLPLNARDAGFLSWLNRENGSDHASFGGRYSVLLQFASEAINIGDIATGRVKNVIDCLRPITGDDRSIEFLQVEKGASSLQAGGVRIVIVRI